MLIKDDVTNFIGGVSQQPSRMMFANQSKEVINALLSPTEGVIKRPPSEHIKKLMGVSEKHPLIHTVFKEDEEYSVFLTGADIKVFDLEGNEKTVSSTNLSYITTNTPLKDLFATTIGDYTFILNKKITAELTDDVVTNLFDNSALIFLKKANFGTTYTVTINGSVVATYTTPSQVQSTTDGGVYSTTSSNDGDKATTTVISQLKSQIATNLPTWTVTLLGNCILITNPTTTSFTIKVSDSNADTDIYSFYKEARAVTDLPANAPNGFVLKIIGDGSDNADDYYVKFKTADDSSYGTGGWEECCKTGIKYKINKNTMPHALIRESNGTFTFKPLDWTERQAGDEISVPTPSFIGNTIQSIFSHKGRLALLSGDKSIFSDVDDIFSFFKSTALAELDTDPIDCGSNSKMVLLKHAVPYKETLLLFSETSVFNITGGDIFSNATASIDLVLEYPCLKNCTPVNIGNNILFCSENGIYTKVREIYPSQSGLNARDVSEQIPNYILKGIYKIIPSVDSNVVCFLTERDRSKIFIYNFLYSSDEKVQSAWSKWNFENATILGADFHYNFLYLYMQYEDGIYLERIDFTSQKYETDLDFKFYLDRKYYVETGVYDSFNNITTFTKKYPNVNEIIVVDENGFPLEIEGETTTTVSVFGDYSNVCIGNTYTMEWELPTLYYRTTDRSGNVKVQEGLLMLRDISLFYNRTGYFKVLVIPKYTTAISSEFIFTGIITGTATAQIGQMPISDGIYIIPVISKNEDIDKIKVINDSHLPSCFTNLSWLGDFTVRGDK